MATQDWKTWAAEVTSLLGLENRPLAITFCQEAPPGTPPYEAPTPEPAHDGRTGKVPAGCVFWVKATDRTFTTVPEDHGNCSVGSLTHGLKTMDEIVGNADVAALIESGWVRMDMVPKIPMVRLRPNYITYGPLQESTGNPDVILLRLNPKQVMVVHDAFPEMLFEGKPQCHIIAMAKEHDEIAASVGCMLSRVRTGLPSSQMTCAIPARRLPEVVQRLKTTCQADTQVAAYAAEDSRRFA